MAATLGFEPSADGLTVRPPRLGQLMAKYDGAEYENRTRDFCLEGRGITTLTNSAQFGGLRVTLYGSPTPLVGSSRASGLQTEGFQLDLSLVLSSFLPSGLAPEGKANQLDFLPSCLSC